MSDLNKERDHLVQCVAAISGLVNRLESTILTIESDARHNMQVFIPPKTKHPQIGNPVEDDGARVLSKVDTQELSDDHVRSLESRLQSALDRLRDDTLAPDEMKTELIEAEGTSQNEKISALLHILTDQLLQPKSDSSASSSHLEELDA